MTVVDPPIDASTEPILDAGDRNHDRVSRWKTWFLPNEVDAFVFWACLMLIVAVLDPWFESIWLRWRRVENGGLVWMAALAGTLTGAAFAAGRSRLRARTAVWMLIVSLVSFACFLWASQQVQSGINFVWDSTYAPTSSRPVVEWGMFLLGGALGFLALAATTFVLAFLLNLLKTKMTVRGKISRQNWMILAACLLFVLQLIQRVAVAQTSGNFAVVRLAGGGLITLLCFVVVANFLTDNHWKLRWKFLLVMFSVSGFAVFVVFGPTLQSQRSLVKPMEIVFCLVCAFTMLVSNSSGTIANTSRSAERKRPSLWSVLPVAIFLATGFGVYAFDLSILVDSDWKRWDEAWAANDISRRTDKQVRIGFGGFVACELGENSDPDVLSCLEGRAIGQLQISGLTPNIDVSPLTIPQVIQLKDSTLTSNQFEHLVADVAWMRLIDNVDVVDSDETVAMTAVRINVVHARRPEQLASIFGVTDPASEGVIQFWADELSRNDLAAIEKLSQQVPVVSLAPIRSEDDKILKNLIYDFRDPFMANMIERFEETPSGQRQMTRFVLRTDCFVVLPEVKDKQLFWDLVFVKNKKTNGSFEEKTLGGWNQQGIDLRQEDIERFHLVYGKDSNGMPTDLILPCAEGRLETFNRLGAAETISFDPDWLTGLDAKSAQWRDFGGLGRGISFEGRYLAKMPNLKRVDFSWLAENTDPLVLTRLPKIEHLQIRLHKDIKRMVDFRVCKNLKRLIYFGTPPKSTMTQLAALKQLEKVTIVDMDDGNLFSKAAQQNLRTSIPGVEIELVVLRDYRATPPAKFLKYVELKSVELRKKLLEWCEEDL